VGLLKRFERREVMKNLDDRSIEDQISKRRKSEKANTVFLRLLSKQKSKHKDWSDARAETYPAKDIKPGADDVY